MSSGSKRPFHIIAHRGAARFAPENTIEAFEKAVELGANAIETDVFRRYDMRGYDTVLVHDPDHDKFFARVRQWGVEFFSSHIPHAPSRGSGLRRPLGSAALLDPFAVELAYGYIRRVHLSELWRHWRQGMCRFLEFWTKIGALEMTCRYVRHPSLLFKKKHRDVPLTHMEDFIRFTRREKRIKNVFFDIKHEPWQSDAAVGILHELESYVAEGGLSHLTFHLMSVHEAVVRALLDASWEKPNPSITVWVDVDRPGVRRITRRLGVQYAAVGRGARMLLWWMFWPQVVVALWKCRLQSIVVWTVNGKISMRLLIKLGVDGIITDRPERLRTVVEKKCPELMV